MTLTELVRVSVCILSVYDPVLSHNLVGAHDSTQVDVGTACQTLSTEHWSLNASFLLLFSFKDERLTSHSLSLPPILWKGEGRFTS